MEYSQKADLWSAGILAYQLLSGRLPFVGESGLLVSKLYMAKQLFTNKDVFRAILYADMDFEREPWPHVSPEAKALVQALLTRDPARRPTAAEALAHPWFARLDDTSGAPAAAAAEPPLLDTVVQRLQRFGTYGRLKQVALRQIANVALTVAGSSDMVAEIKAVFADLDPAGRGKVPYSALVTLLQRRHFELSDTEVEVRCGCVDRSCIGGSAGCGESMQADGPTVSLSASKGHTLADQWGVNAFCTCPLQYRCAQYNTEQARPWPRRAHVARTQVLISQMDVDRSGFVRYEDWLAAMLEWRALQERDEWDAWVSAAFDAFNVDGSGRVGVAELQTMLCKDGVCAMPDIVAAALRCACSPTSSRLLHVAHAPRTS